MSELDSLERSLLELLAKLDLATCPIILGGGYGLYLRRNFLVAAGTRTLLDQWPEARSTNDLDLFLRPEFICDSSRLSVFKQALDELGYAPVKGAEHYQFRKHDPAGVIQRGIKIDLLTGPSSAFQGTTARVDVRRVRPRPSVEVHAHPTDEAITLVDDLQKVKLASAGRASKPFVFLPHPFTYVLMKLYAFRDQVGDASREHGSHHALDLYAIVAMMTEAQWNRANEMAARHASSSVVQEAARIVGEMFASTTSQGLLMMRGNPYCRETLQLDEFIALVQELFAIANQKDR